MYFKKRFAFLFLILTVVAGVQEHNTSENTLKLNSNDFLHIFRLADRQSVEISEIKTKDMAASVIKQLYNYERVSADNTWYLCGLTFYAGLFIFETFSVYHKNNILKKNNIGFHAVF